MQQRGGAYAKGVLVWNRNETEAGTLTGAQRLCTLEGCGGLRLYVRWTDGKITIPCTKGMTWDEGREQWKIG